VTTLPLTVPELVIDVEGEPIPQGSLIPVRRGARTVLVSDNPRLKGWRAAVVAAAEARMRLAGWVTLDCACSVTVDFYLERPVSAPRTRLRPDRRPDVDKAARAILDALTTAQAFRDDARVVELIARKHYAHQTIGARIVVSAL
jgi:Holliday junction resolvase RusA-like endonuclease